MVNFQKLKRRQFLQATGFTSAGLILGAKVNASTAVPTDIISGAKSQAEDFLRLNLFVELALDGTVRIVCHRSEMGQGIRTGLPQVLADEMELDWERVQVVQGQADSAYGSQNTDGSRSVRDFYFPMRQLGAAAKSMLIQAAATQWKKPVSECYAQNSEVRHRGSDRRSSYGDLAKAAANLEMPKLDGIALKPKSKFNFIGKGLASVDLQAMLTGKAQYGLDIDLPGMVYASIERCPVVGGQLESLDDSEARAQNNVLDIIKMPGGKTPVAYHPLSGVAVIAKHTWAALQGRKKLKIKWAHPGQAEANAKHNSSRYQAGLSASHKSGAGERIFQTGDVEKAFSHAAQQIEAEYSVPYLAHAPMEPPAAVALDKGAEGMEIWACTQTPQSLQKSVAQALGMDPAKVTVHVTYLGGGFGRKSKPDFAVEAALIARAIKKPVKLCWSREDDIHFDYLHAINSQAYRAALDKNGRVSAWEASNTFPTIMSTFNGSDTPADWELSQGFVGLPYDIANVRLWRQKAEAHMRIGWLRSVINIPNAFAISSFVDELALAAKKDPREFLLQTIGADREIQVPGFDYSNYGKTLDEYPYQTARSKAVINKVCESAEWEKPLASGEAWGLAYHYSFLSHVAVAAKVKWDGKSAKVIEIHCACDAGQIVNPDRVRSQLEGAMIFGTSIALYSEITVDEGRVVEGNFDGYRLTRMQESPDITIELMESDDLPRGVGEPGVPPVAPAIANALARAGGPRIRDLPIAKHLPL